MDLFRNSIEDFIGRAFGIGATVPDEYFFQIMTKLNIDRCGLLTIGVEPGENLLEAFRWNCRVSRHFEVVSSARMSQSLVTPYSSSSCEERPAGSANFEHD